MLSLVVAACASASAAIRPDGRRRHTGQRREPSRPPSITWSARSGGRRLRRRHLGACPPRQRNCAPSGASACGGPARPGLHIHPPQGRTDYGHHRPSGARDHHATPIASAVDRVLEVAVGALTGFVVSFLLLPSRAHGLAADAAARTLDHMARALRALLAGHAEGLDTDAPHRIQTVSVNRSCDWGSSQPKQSTSALIRIAAEPDTRPLTRTLLRLRHDLVMIGRAALPPPAALESHLRPHLERIGATVADYLHGGARFVGVRVHQLAMASTRRSTLTPPRSKRSAVMA